jgi:hypothetical protein
LRTIGLTTHRRLDALKRGLPGYLGNARLYDRDIEFAVIDDSKDEAAERLNREWLAGFAKAEGVSIRYAGTAERREFAGKLSAISGVLREIIEFAIFGSESLAHGVPCITTLSGAGAMVEAIRALAGGSFEVRSLQQLHQQRETPAS